MSITYPLRVFLDCSTAHLSQDARTYLDREDSFAATTPFGWFVWVGPEAEDQMPLELEAVMAHARSLGSEYILFDCDAEEDPTLPTFDWSS